MKYFIASRWASMKQIQVLTENLTTLGHEVFSFVSDKRNFVTQNELQKPRVLFEKTENWEKNPEVRKVYEHDLEGLRQADTVILLLPAGVNSHIEAGIAFGLGKHLVLIGEPETVETHYLIFDEFYKTIEEYVASLKK